MSQGKTYFKLSNDFIPDSETMRINEAKTKGIWPNIKLNIISNSKINKKPAKNGKKNVLCDPTVKLWTVRLLETRSSGL